MRIKLDDHNLSSTYQSSNDWFNKELPMDILEGMYRRITKPFKKDEYRQVLDYYTSTDKDVKDVVMIGCDVDVQKITDFNDIVATWKDGKMDSDATFTYVDAVTEFDYDSVQKAAYIKKVQQIKSDKKKNK